MTHKSLLVGCLTALLLTPLPSAGQIWSDAQTAVWTVILESYEDTMEGNADWSDRWVHPNAVVWGDTPMPRNRATVKMWDRVQMARSTTLVQSFEAAAIVVQGTTAFAHYYASALDEEDGETETTHTRCTDILVNEGGSWLFIGWNCMEIDDD